LIDSKKPLVTKKVAFQLLPRKFVMTNMFVLKDTLLTFVARNE
jgi:hypothetical protein